MAELSSRGGTSVASIKYYLREGLLPAGTATGRNQAEYDESHVRRLRLIRALIDVGGLSISAARAVLSAVDSPEVHGHALLGAAHQHLVRPARRGPTDPAWRSARARMLTLVRDRGWYVSEHSPSLDQAADAISAMQALGQDDLVTVLDTYADASATVAEREVDVVVQREDPAAMIEGVIVGTILGESLLNAVRRLAQEDASARRLLTPSELDELARQIG